MSLFASGIEAQTRDANNGMRRLWRFYTSQFLFYMIKHQALLSSFVFNIKTSIWAASERLRFRVELVRVCQIITESFSTSEADEKPTAHLQTSPYASRCRSLRDHLICLTWAQVIHAMFRSMSTCSGCSALIPCTGRAFSGFYKLGSVEWFNAQPKRVKWTPA